MCYPGDTDENKKTLGGASTPGYPRKHATDCNYIGTYSNCKMDGWTQKGF